MPEKVRASPAGTPGCPQGRQAALDLLLPDPDEEEPPDDDPPDEPLLDDEEDEEDEEPESGELLADDPVEAPDSLFAPTAPVEDERLSFR
jgi:hypothetical protein